MDGLGSSGAKGRGLGNDRVDCWLNPNPFIIGRRNEPVRSPDKVEANAECGCTKYGKLSPLQC